MDRARLQLVVETDEEKAALIGLFFRIAHDCTHIMQNSLELENTKWSRAAHSLKGSASNLGMHNLEVLCQKAEKSEKTDAAWRQEMLACIHAEIQRIRDYIKLTEPSCLPGDSL